MDGFFLYPGVKSLGGKIIQTLILSWSEMLYERQKSDHTGFVSVILTRVYLYEV